jgi:hypothetical protein
MNLQMKPHYEPPEFKCNRIGGYRLPKRWYQQINPHGVTIQGTTIHKT